MNKHRKIIILTIILVIAGFYWFQIRPAQARKDCIDRYPDAFGRSDPPQFTGGGRLSGGLGSNVDYWLKHKDDGVNYERCLREHGINE